MKKYIFLFLFFSLFSNAQNEYLAQNYYDRGEFEKAIINYEELLKTNPNNFDFQSRLIDCYQQMQNYSKAEQTIKNIIQKFQIPQFYVELGFNFQLQKNQIEADKNYQIALKKIEENPNFTYSIAQIFEKKNLLELALKSYQIGVAKNPNMNANFQIGLLYGQMGKTDLMIENLMKEAFENQLNMYAVQSYFQRFMQNDTDEIFTNALKKTLILAVQKNQDMFFNQMLSWFFVSLKDYKSAFIQEKAIYKKKQENFNNLVNLGVYSIDDDKNETAKEIFEYIKTQTKENEVLLTCNYYLLKIDIENPIITKEVILNQFDTLFKEYPNYNLIELKILYANYLAFNNIDIEKAKKSLKSELEKSLPEKEIAQIKMELANIMVFDEKFNQALILYSQVEEDMKNDELAHQASFKIAKTSYFKQDFDWALAQLKVLKSASSQLIANDALELFLLLNDNIPSDSTKTALIKFAKADFLLYKKNNQEALKIFEEIYKTHFKEEIADETLFKIATIHQKNGNYDLAITKYQELLEKFTESIYKDEALFFAGNIYNEHFNLPEKAKEMYEKVILNHKDSIYFTEARNNYRKLRGDKLL
jgi:tetratricopeptide (TPR) repeat protein